MKGVILAGGTGSRLRPLTYISNKHLLGIYDKPMIEYPLDTLVSAGIEDILIVSGREHAGHFLNYLGSGKDRGLNFMYKVQEGAGGIAEALSLAKDFVGDEKFAVILGDNIYRENYKKTFERFELSDRASAVLFVKSVKDPERFGVLNLKKRNDLNSVISIIEKPKKAPSRYAVTGLYLYDSFAFEIIDSLVPSARGELEITDLNNYYIKQNGQVIIQEVKGFWSDAGTFDSMLLASNYIKNEKRGK